MGDWGFTWAPRWFSSTEDLYAVEANAVNKAKAMWYHDVQATYDFDGWGFVLGIRNLLDEDPPYVSNYDDMNTVNSSYDLAGRYFYGRVIYSF
jgi:iron complex outermembrane receptor protein